MTLFDKDKMKLESVIDVGETVLCDICNADYSYSERKGGFLFNSKSVCPRCEPRMRENIAKHKEERFIKAECPKEMSFREFVLKCRKGDNTIKIYVEKGKNESSKSNQKSY